VDSGFDPAIHENIPITMPEMTQQVLDNLLFQKHCTIRHLKPSMASALARLCNPLLGAILHANENDNEARVNEATCAFLLAPVLTQKFPGPLSLNREIDILLEAQNIAKATLELAYRSIYNGNHPPPTATTAGPPAATVDDDNSSNSSSSNSILPAVAPIPRRSTRLVGQAAVGASVQQQRETPTTIIISSSSSSNNNTSSVNYGGQTAATVSSASSTAARQQEHDEHQQQEGDDSSSGLSPHLAKKVAAHIRANQLSKAIEILERSLLGSSPLKDSLLTEENIAEFQSLHPTGEGFQFNRAHADDPIEITRKDIAYAIFGSKKEIASAFSPWSNELIRIIWGFEHFKDHLLRIYNLMLSGKLLGKQLWITSRSILLKKANGKIRPIAIGDPFIRILSKVVASKFKIQAHDYFHPYQYANGIPSGTEIISHALQNFFNSQSPSKDKVIIALDCKNAFNSVHRNQIYERLAATFPSYLHFFNWKYGSETALILSDGTNVGVCSEGVHQGDPWASMLFTLALHTVLQEFKVFQPHAFIFGPQHSNHC